MPKQSRLEAVTLAEAGASPVDHPTGTLTVKTPLPPVKRTPSGQLGASPSAPTKPCRRRPTGRVYGPRSHVVEVRVLSAAPDPLRGGTVSIWPHKPDVVGATPAPATKRRDRPTAEPAVSRTLVSAVESL